MLRTCATVFCLGCLTVSTQAAIITQTGTNSFGESWLTANDWSNNAAPSAGNDYVSSTAGHTVRSPFGSPSFTFGGKSLSISNGVILSLKASPSTLTINNLTLNGGLILHSGDHTLSGGGLVTIAGSGVQFLGSSIVGPNGALLLAETPRNIAFSAPISGNGTINLRGAITTVAGLNQAAFVRFTNAANTFTGNIVVGSPGSANLMTFESTTAFSTPGSLSITNLGRLNLTANYSFGTASVNGNALPGGTYTYSDLNALGYGSFFVNGAGTLTVVPEPASLTLAAIGAVALRRRRRA